MRQDHSAILRGNEMLFVGGCNFGKGKCYCDLNILNLRNLAWREEKTKGVTDDLVVSPREDHTMTMVRGKAFLFGGCYLAQRCYNDMYTLEPSTGHLRCGGNDCSGHGVCRAYANREKSMTDKETYACACQPGYTGEDCSEITSCPNDCSGHGMCKSNFQCSCNNGWTLKDCSLQVKCPGIVKPKPTKLNLGNQSSDANTMTLFVEVNSSPNETFVPCAGNGECRSDGHCECREDWYGPDCSRNRICPNDCSGHGACAGPPKAESIKRAMVATAVAGKTSFVEEQAHIESTLLTRPSLVYCHCDEGFSGRDCSTPRENIIETVIHMSVSMRKMKKKTLYGVT